MDDAKALVRGYPGECLSTWDYRYESPRADLRGFQLDRLAVDPIDVRFDEGRSHGKAEDVRSDRILPNGARFYNDHGHPEYSTPECWSLRALAEHDRYGESVVLDAAEAFATQTEREVRVYKNNTDFHGASYGTHENYLVPRGLGFQQLYDAVLPVLVARSVLTGAGKVGSEAGDWVDYQISQRADFFMEPVNAETLYRRPVFNTRDECHSDPSEWIRLHVISGDANMMPACTRRKAGLVKLAIHLAEVGEAPVWKLRDPVRAIQSLSRDLKHEFKVELEGRNWTTAYEMFESLFSAAEHVLDLDEELVTLIQECRALMSSLQAGRWQETRGQIDWAAKRHVLEQFMAEEGGSWKDGSMRAFDLEYHNVDPQEGLYHALEHMGEVESPPEGEPTVEASRALARGIAVSRFKDHVQTACWRSISFRMQDKLVEVDLKPDMLYSSDLSDVHDVETFVRMLRGEK